MTYNNTIPNNRQKIRPPEKGDPKTQMMKKIL